LIFQGWYSVLWFIALICFIFLVTFVFSKKKKGDLLLKNNDAEMLEIHMNDLLPKSLLKAMSKIPYSVPIPIYFKDKKNKPISEVSVKMIFSNTLNLNYTTDAKGIVTIELNSGLIEENPLLKFSKNNYKAKDLFYVIGGKTMKFTDTNSNFNIIDLRDLSVLNTGFLKIFYKKEEFKKAQELSIITTELIRDIEKIIGFYKLKPLNIILTKIKNSTTIEECNDNLLPIDADNKEDIYWFFVHEFIEINLITAKDIYSKNKYLRWIGDGLAEYVSFKILENKDVSLKSSMLKERINNISNKNIQSFNLLDWEVITGSTEGYSFSLAFWINFEKKFGFENLQNFIHDFIKNKDYETDTVTKLLLKNIDKEKNQFFIMSSNDALEILLKSLESSI